MQVRNELILMNYEPMIEEQLKIFYSSAIQEKSN